MHGTEERTPPASKAARLFCRVFVGYEWSPQWDGNSIQKQNFKQIRRYLPVENEKCLLMAFVIVKHTLAHFKLGLEYSVNHCETLFKDAD